MPWKPRKEPWGGEMFAYHRKALEDLELPMPPWGIVVNSKLWDFRCTAKGCKKTALFSRLKCGVHSKVSNTTIRMVYEKLARVIIEYCNYRLPLLMNEMEEWSPIQMVRMSPRVLAMYERVLEILPLLDGVVLSTTAIRWNTEEHSKFMNGMMGAGGIVVEFYIKQLRPRANDNQIVMELFENVVYWACDYIEMVVDVRS